MSRCLSRSEIFLTALKGLIFTNAVEEVTQFQYVRSVENISERYLLAISHVSRMNRFAIEDFCKVLPIDHAGRRLWNPRESLCRCDTCGPPGFQTLVALGPKSRVSLTRFHGVFAPNSMHREQVRPAKRGNGTRASKNDCFSAFGWDMCGDRLRLIMAQLTRPRPGSQRQL
ncbi:MAG: hypothetical protein ACI8PT_004070 [Gammaproteobacteria bacterium]|jgi:hypothetical protein